MKRLTYISKASRPLSDLEIQQLGEVAVKNNLREAITGVLLYLNGIFFQVFEGEEAAVELLFAKIQVDERHQDILCLKTEYHIPSRQFPNWGMKTINLDENTDILMQPIKSLLQTVAESYRIVERYTQPSVMNLLHQGINPLMQSPRLVEKIIYFSDIVAFSTFTEQLPVTEVITLVNHYFTLCTQIILAHGGEVTKFIGDCVMASFAGDQGDNAIRASLTVLSELKKLREQTKSNNPLHWLYTGIGLSYGEVIEGNIGSSLKMDYTLLGDAVNVAARLEALTRQLPYALVLTAGVTARCNPNYWSFVPLGQHHAKGKHELIEVFSVAEEITKQSQEVRRLTEIIRQTLV